MRHILSRPGPVLRALLLLAAAAGAAFPAALDAQSLFAGRGLGLVVDPAAARAQALGGVEQGLLGLDFSWSNPAEAVGLPVAGLRLAFQNDDFSASYSGRTAEGSTARFPLIQVASPIGDLWAVSLGFGGFLDQSYAVESFDTVMVGEDSVAVLDRLTSEGGVARVRLGAAYRVVQGLAVGLGVDVYTGSVQRSFGRTFSEFEVPGCCRTEWRYSGVGMLGGVAWNPSEAVSLGVSGSLGGTLDAGTDDTLSVASSFDLPATAQGGASARVAPSLMLAVGGSWAGWSSLDTPLADVGGARDAWSINGGIEWDAIQLRGRPLPVRLGARQAALPFRWGEVGTSPEWAEERAFTGGLGLVLAGGATLTDVALERGRRGGPAAGLEEEFWRMTFSITVLGR